MKTKLASSITFFEEHDDIVDIRKDNVFKAVFTKDTPAAQGALSKLVSALIGIDVSIEKILANEPSVDSLQDRQIRYDINCIAQNGERINVEMCLNPRPFELVRMEFHAGKLFSSQDIRGIEKNFRDLKKTFQIAILANGRLLPDGVFFHAFEYYDPANKVSLNGRTRVITLELSKLDKVVEKPINEMSVPELWAVFFQYLTDLGKRSKINEIVKQDEGIAMASEVLMTISKDEEERIRMIKQEMNILDWQSDLALARSEGFEKGCTKEKHKIAQRMKDIGLSPEQILATTGIHT